MKHGKRYRAARGAVDRERQYTPVEAIRRRHGALRHPESGVEYERIEAVPLDEKLAVFEERAVDLVALDDTLRKLEAIAPRQAEIVELRFFAGLSIEEAAEALGVGHATVEREWAMARAWLRKELA